VIRRGDLRPAFFVPLRRSKPDILVSDVFWAEEGIGLKIVDPRNFSEFWFHAKKGGGLNMNGIERGLFLTFTVGGGWSVFFVSLHAKDQKVRG
jgi:hypothetical protein